MTPPAPPLPAPTSTTFVAVALGSNTGPSGTSLRAALDRLRSLARGDFRASSLWRSSPVDCPPGSPDFLNAAACFDVAASESPESLLATLQAWEREFGRRPKQVLNEPRPLDLDLLVFGSETRCAPSLILPHPRAHLRRFVLEPLAEIAPDLHPPGWAATVARTLAGLVSDEMLERLPEGFGS